MRREYGYGRYANPTWSALRGGARRARGRRGGRLRLRHGGDGRDPVHAAAGGLGARRARATATTTCARSPPSTCATSRCASSPTDARAIREASAGATRRLGRDAVQPGARRARRRALARDGRRRRALVVDNTLATPLRQRPLEPGARRSRWSAPPSISRATATSCSATRPRATRRCVGGAALVSRDGRRDPGAVRGLARPSLAGDARRAPRAPGGDRARARRRRCAERRRRRPLARRRLGRLLRPRQRGGGARASSRRRALVAEATSFGGVHTSAERRGALGHRRRRPGLHPLQRRDRGHRRRRRRRPRRPRLIARPRTTAPLRTRYAAGRPFAGERSSHSVPGTRWDGADPSVGGRSLRRPSWPARPPSTSAPPAATPRPVARAVPRLRGVEHARRGAAPAAAAAGAASAAGPRGRPARPTPLREVRAERVARLTTGIGELDRVLGGGIVPGSLVLLGGSPGIGKSTLTGMARATSPPPGARTLYVSGEESAAQVRLRAERLETAACRALDVPVLGETDLDAVLATIEAERPDVCVIDSVQTLHAAELTGAPGSVGQVREVAGRVMAVAKRAGTAVVLVGHVTKEGSIAGPARARAPRRLRPAVRGRARAHLPHAARAEEPLRLDERDRRLRDGRGRARRGPRRQRPLRRRGHRQARQRRARRDGGLAPAARRGPGARLARPSSCRRGASATASTATASRSCSPCSAATPASGPAPPTCSSTSSAACASTSRAPTSRSPWRSPARRAASRPAGQAAGRFGEVGLTGELRSVAHPDRRLGRGGEVRPAPVVEPGLLPDAARRAARGAGRPASAPRPRRTGAHLQRIRARCPRQTERMRRARPSVQCWPVIARCQTCREDRGKAWLKNPW